jgi:hypothetical protein
MKYLVCALALIVMSGSSCKSKSAETNPVPEIGKESPLPPKPAPENHPTEPSDGHHHGSGQCGEGEKCHHKHKKIPPGHAKKMHGAQSARDYTPGHTP